jgi:hypothetical protein
MKKAELQLNTIYAATHIKKYQLHDSGLIKTRLVDLELHKRGDSWSGAAVFLKVEQLRYTGWNREAKEEWIVDYIQSSQIRGTWEQHETAKAEKEIELEKMRKDFAEREASYKIMKEKVQKEFNENVLPTLQAFQSQLQELNGGAFISLGTKLEQLPLEVVAVLVEALNAAKVAN